jgi:hypothetical protein
MMWPLALLHPWFRPHQSNLKKVVVQREGKQQNCDIEIFKHFKFYCYKLLEILLTNIDCSFDALDSMKL